MNTTSEPKAGKEWTVDGFIELYSAQESGVGGSWEWVVTMASNPDGTYRLLVEQVLWDSDEGSEPASYELPIFRTGEELFDFLQSTWHVEHAQGLEAKDWEDIEATIRKVDKVLANQLNHHSQTVFCHVESVKAEEHQLIHRCIEGAIWEKNVYSGGGAMWATIADQKKMARAVAAYVQDYYAQTGAVPEGVHRVHEKDVTFPLRSSPLP